MKASPLIILGAFATISICLYIGGCVATKPNNWTPMFTVIPALLACVCAYAFNETDENTFSDDSCATSPDAWFFFLFVCITSATALPFVFYHCGTISLTSLLLHVAGDVSTAIGFSLYLYLDDDSIQNY